MVSTTRYDLDLKSYPGAQVVHRIERGGAVLTVIKTTLNGIEANDSKFLEL